MESICELFSRLLFWRQLWDSKMEANFNISVGNISGIIHLGLFQEYELEAFVALEFGSISGITCRKHFQNYDLDSHLKSQF